MQRGHLDDRSLNRFGNGQGNLDLQVVARPREDRRTGYPRDDVQVSRVGSPDSGLALAGEADAASVAHARGYVDAKPAHAALRTAALTGRARVLDDRSGSL